MRALFGVFFCVTRQSLPQIGEEQAAVRGNSSEGKAHHL